MRVPIISTITCFLQALDLAWEIMPKTSNGQAPKSYLRVGLDTLAPYAGLPPVGAVSEVKELSLFLFLSVSEIEGEDNLVRIQ